MSQSVLFLLEFTILVALLASVLLLTVPGAEKPQPRLAFLSLLAAIMLVFSAAVHLEVFLNRSIANATVIVAACGVIITRIWKYGRGSLFRTASSSGNSIASSQERARNLDPIKIAYFNFAPYIFLALDKEGSVIAINKHGCEVVSCDSPHIIQRNWFNDFVASSDRGHDLKVFRECLETQEERRYKSHLRDRQDHLRLIQWKSCYDKGTDVVLYVGQDITEGEAQHLALTESLRKVSRLKERLEERVRTHTRDLESINMDLELQIDERKVIEDRLIISERLYSKIAHNFPDGLIAVLDVDFSFVMVDGRELPLLGLSADDLVGASIFEGSNPLLDERMREQLQTVLEDRSINFEVTRNSNIYGVTAGPLYDQQETIYAILLVMQNITERKNLEEHLYKTIEQEKKLNDLKTRFVTMASHEFRTPLSTILSSLFLLETYTGELYEEKKAIHIDRIKRTVNMLTETLNDFMRLARLEEGRVEMVLREVNIIEYADDIRKEMQAASRQGQIIQYRHEGSDFNVLIDRNLLRSVFTNLLSNAIKYSPEGAEIVLQTFLASDRLVINVIDHGIGIAPEEHEHIFQRFFRALNAMNIDGAGLGLHIIKKYVEMMKGTINFASDDSGTIFTVTIPLQLSSARAHLMLK